MTPNSVSRRTVLASTGAVAGFGALGWYIIPRQRETKPGAEGFSAKTAPQSSDPLLVVDADEILQRPAIRSGVDTFLDGQAFNSLPEPLRALFDGTETPLDPNSIGKLVFVDPAPQGAVAVIWADWTRDDLANVLENATQGSIESGSYRSRTTYSTETTTAAVLADQAFAIGATEPVRAVVDVWHGEDDPVAQAVLDPFERTPQSAPVRFAASSMNYEGDTPDLRTDAYDRIVNASGWIEVRGGDPALGFQYQVDSIDVADSVASTLRADLSPTAGEGSDEWTLSESVRNDITVERTGDIIRAEYQDAEELFADHVGQVIRVLAGPTKT